MKELFIFERTGKLVIYQNNWEIPNNLIYDKTNFYFEIFVENSKMFDIYKYFFDCGFKDWDIVVIKPTALPKRIKALLLIKGIN